MQNALTYFVSKGNRGRFINRMLNSINSFFRYNKNLLADTEVLVWTPEPTLELYGIDDGINCKVIKKFSYDYESLPNTRWGKQIWYTLEMLINPLFLDYDNVLYLDCDTEVVSSVEPLLNSPGGVLMPKDPYNFLKKYDFMPKDWRYFNSGTILIRPKILGREVM